MAHIWLEDDSGGMFKIANPRVGTAVQAILKERGFQDSKYGVPYLLSPQSGEKVSDGPGGHPLAAWVIILEAELNECKKAIVHGGMQSQKGRDSVRSEIVQVAAVALAALEQHGVEE